MHFFGWVIVGLEAVVADLWKKKFVQPFAANEIVSKKKRRCAIHIRSRKLLIGSKSMGLERRSNIHSQQSNIHVNKRVEKR